MVRELQVPILLVLALAGCSGADPTRDGPEPFPLSLPVRDAPPRAPIRVMPELVPSPRLPAGPGHLAGCSLLLVTIDTTRADYIGCYGREAARTPVLDALARSGVLFADAVTPAPTTLPAHASLLTGRRPKSHGVRTNGTYRLLDGEETLAEVLRARGFATAAVVSTFVLDEIFGLSQGFDAYDDDVGNQLDKAGLSLAERNAGATTDRSIAWLAEHGGERFFLWTHYFDPHAPYAPPAGYTGGDPYDGEIAYVDAQIGRLVAELKRQRRLEDTLIVVTSDHGEGFAQQGENAHGYLLYNATLQVPLILSCGARLGGGVQLASRVSLVDVMPTVLSLMGVDAPPALDGVDLCASAGAGRPIFVETLYGRVVHGWAPLYAVFDGPDKYVQGPSPELFDLAADPFEEHSLLLERPDRVLALDGRLATVFGDEARRDVLPAATHALDAGQRAALDGLGYATGDEGDRYAKEARPDPAAMLYMSSQVEMCVDRFHGGGADLASTVRDLEAVIRARPRLTAGFWHLGELYREQGRFDDAARCVETGLAQQPENDRLLKLLARVRFEEGQVEEAGALFRRVLAAYPDAVEALTGLAACLERTGAGEELVELYERILPIYPDDELHLNTYIQAVMANGRDAQGIALMERLLEEDPGRALVRVRLVALLGKAGRFARSMTLMREAVALDPTDLDQRHNLAMALLKVPDPGLQDPQEAQTILEQICVDDKDRSFAYLMSLSRVYAGNRRLPDAVSAAERALAAAQRVGASDVSAAIANDLAAMRAALPR